MKRNRSTGRRLRLEALEQRRMMAVFHVDDDFTANDPAAREFTTIQAAVDAAAAGDKIKVEPGTYAENVVVDKKLKIVGAEAALADALNPDVASIVDPIDNAITSAPGVGFELDADGIEIKGFTIGGLDNDNDADATIGIRTSELFSGYRIKNNVIQDNTVGIYLNTATTESSDSSPGRTRVKNNVIRDNNRVGTNTGNGIFSDLGLQNVRIKDNTFTGENNDSSIKIVAEEGDGIDTLRSDIKIKHNDFDDTTGAGIYFEQVVDSKIKRNDFQNIGASGIQLNGGNQHVTISRNKLVNPGTDEFDGIILNDSSELGPNQHNVIKRNTITGAGLSGLVIRDSSFNTIKRNKITGSQAGSLEDSTAGNGISLENADNNTIKRNKVEGNARNGIFLDDESSDNLVRKNKSKNNNTDDLDAFDYNDESSGDGTAGTDNTYEKNKGITENVTGLIAKFID